MAGRTILIAGGAGGMGLATGLRFAADGERIALADLAGPKLDAAVAKIAATGADVIGLPLDIRSVDACREVVGKAKEWGGAIDILVNAAGVWLEGPASEVEEEQWDLVLDVNLKGAFFLISAAIPHLSAAQGVIVNIASDAGIVGNNGAAVYCASKGGLVLLTKALALELAPQGIRVNAVCPGDTATPMIEYQAKTYGADDPDGYKRRLLGHYPQGDRARFIQVEEIASFIHYLCQPGAAPITGAALSIDFGVTAGY
ncbi:SDR family oxidoreductase [Mesorhizobium sp. B3-1-3]|uniref:SDR family NAD(P)-dependent oxidoreductase n=1 Tax=unclassified Mesorhizobium TaxID=325217 RepID=UPI00112605D8|nr:MULTISPECIES: SDR family oxidoreductase [unclassified Mesorhizobium]TPI60188.1 SDR family oxidoreductase [Mesorhizobium sp. B3-1-7]TPI66304.1 SDR family oxidoreductase [Mesorhizobium sp. B3-1-8]TPI73159.1 SDR family oxidoreductase [Mesorhizobium sp. B3-1-3]